MFSTATTASPASLAVHPDGDSGVVLVLSGDWTLGSPHPDADLFLADSAPFGTATRARVDATALGRWDSSLLVFLRGLSARAAAANPPVALDLSSLPAGARTLLDLAAAPSPSGAPPHAPEAFRPPFYGPFSLKNAPIMPFSPSATRSENALPTPSSAQVTPFPCQAYPFANDSGLGRAHLGYLHPCLKATP